ncbi:glycosyltransferase family 4 protein [Pedobacter sp.]|uniref:glycosyltransferase family 4 protein n=1 Tax=Pedobacter sp. TaxID=1411316 RepID=UPI003D7F1C32
MIYLVVYILSFFLVVFLLAAIIYLCNAYKIYDRNDSLKKNPKKISRLGGVALFMTFLSVNYIFNADPSFTATFYIAFLMLFLLGLGDDLHNIKPYVKFFVQLIVAVLLVAFCQVNSQPELVQSMFWYPTFDTNLGIFVLVLSINAFNLIDGSDGLAAMLGLTINLFLTALLFRSGDVSNTLIGMSISGILSGFLFLNSSPAKVYMGDSGSTFIGLILGILALRVLNLSRDTHSFPDNVPVLLLALFIVLLYDTFRVIFIRLRLGKSPFKGDQNHIHHRLKRYGLSDDQIAGLLTGFTFLMVTAVILLQQMGNLFLCLFLLVACIVFNQTIDYLLRSSFKKT